MTNSISHNWYVHYYFDENKLDFPSLYETDSVEKGLIRRSKLHIQMTGLEKDVELLSKKLNEDEDTLAKCTQLFEKSVRYFVFDLQGNMVSSSATLDKRIAVNIDLSE